jgi:two-component sensor histidine kinase/PAS domain-containing protein
MGETHGQKAGENELAEAVIETISQPLLVLDSDLRVQKVNPAFLNLFHARANESLDRLVYDLGDKQWDIPQLRALLQEVIPQSHNVTDFRVEHDFPSIGHKVMLVNARRIMGQNQRPDLILLAIDDVTEVEAARYELEGQKEYAEKIIDSLREALLVLGWDLRVKHANKCFYDMFRVEPAETEGRLVYDLGNKQWDIPALRVLLEDILPKQQTFNDFEVQHEFEGIGHRTMLLNARRLDHLNLILLAIEDITERKQTQERQQTLASELSHRVKNVITLIDALATQTLARSRSLAEFGEAFHGRLRTVARAHGELLSKHWQSADMEGLARATVEGCGADVSRVQIEGEPIRLAPFQAMAVNLTLHELCTNAIKHGALSGSGRVAITWSLGHDDEGGRCFRLLWEEIGGPRVRSPRRKGYGLQLIETLGPYELHGETRLTFEEAGVKCELMFPWERV